MIMVERNWTVPADTSLAHVALALAGLTAAGFTSVQSYPFRDTTVISAVGSSALWMALDATL